MVKEFVPGGLKKALNKQRKPEDTLHTVTCKIWATNKGVCKYGVNCNFKHGYAPTQLQMDAKIERYECMSVSV